MIFRDHLQGSSEVHQMFCECQLFRCSGSKGDITEIGTINFTEDAAHPSVGVLQIRRGVTLESEHFVPIEQIIGLAIIREISILQCTQAHNAGDFSALHLIEMGNLFTNHRLGAIQRFVE